MIKIQYPFTDTFGVEQQHLVKTFSDEGKPIKQIETGTMYPYGAVDLFPSRFTYAESDMVVGEIYND